MERSNIACASSPKGERGGVSKLRFRSARKLVRKQWERFSTPLAAKRRLLSAAALTLQAAFAGVVRSIPPRK